jgi:hypothetical protein
MSTTKEQCREKEETTPATSASGALDQTIDNIRRTTDEASKDIPSYTQMIDEYQDQTFQQRRF